MNYEDAVRAAYAAFRPNEHPTDAVIKSHADYIRSGYSFQDWLKGFTADAGWRSSEDANLWALTAYAKARQTDKPEQWAQDRIDGGDDFPTVITRDWMGVRDGDQQDQATIDDLRRQLKELQSSSDNAKILAQLKARQDALDQIITIIGKIERGDNNG